MRKFAAACLSLVLLGSTVPKAYADQWSFLTETVQQTVSIKVINTSGSPVKDAEVQVLSPGLSGMARALTDEQGEASISLPSGFAFWVRVWADGYALVERSYVPASDGPTLTLVATPYSAFLTGIIRDHRGLPVSGAQVSLFRAGYGLEESTATNAMGIYTFETVRADGEYVLQVEASGFRPVSQAVSSLNATRRTQFDVTLTPADGRVTGEVLSSDRLRPVQGAQVELLLRGWGRVAESTTDSQGYFDLTAPPLEEAFYQLRVICEDYETYTTAPFTLSDGEWIDFSGADWIALDPLYAEVTGKVFDDKGEPLADVEVHLQRQGLGTVDTDTTDDDGQFSFAKVPAGVYRVRALPDTDDLNHDASEWVEVTGGQAVTINVVTAPPEPLPDKLKAEANLAITVKDHLGKPVRNASVTISWGKEVWEGETDSEGRFDQVLPVNYSTLDGVDSGSGYHVLVEKDGYLPSDQPVGIEPAPSLIDVRRNVDNQARFVLQPEHVSLVGRVVDDQGRPVEGVEVGLLQEGHGQIERTRTDRSGRYEFDHLPLASQGRYLPVIVDPAYVPGAVNPSGTPVEPTVLDASSPRSITLVARPSETTFLGLVQSGDDRPAADATVTVLNPATGAAFSNDTGEDGSYLITLPAAPGAQYLVRAEAPGTAMAAALDVISPGTQFGVLANLTTHASASITGRVLGPDGVPLAGATVLLYAEGSSVPVQFTSTDAAGQYRFDDLVPGRRYAPVAFDGRQELTSLAPGEQVISPLVALSAGETVWADLYLDSRVWVPAP